MCRVRSLLPPFGWGCFQQFGEGIELRFPETPVVIDPICRFAQWPRAQPANAPLRIDPPLNQPCALEHIQVARNRRQRDVERFGEIADGGVAAGKARQYRAARRIGKRSEDAIELPCGAGVGRSSHGGDDTPDVFNRQVKYRSFLGQDRAFSGMVNAPTARASAS